MSVEKSYRQGPEWIDPHPYDMPPAERAAWANGRGAGKREANAEIARLRAELAANNELYSITKSDLAAVSLQYDAAMAVIERLEAAAHQEAEEKVLLKAPWRNDDEVDWTHLDNLLGYSGHGQFWRAVFKEVRAALACRPQGEKS